jgi:hypothetical protein
MSEWKETLDQILLDGATLYRNSIELPRLIQNMGAESDIEKKLTCSLQLPKEFKPSKESSCPIEAANMR